MQTTTVEDLKKQIDETWEHILKLDREGRHIEADLLRFLKDKLNDELDKLNA